MSQHPKVVHHNPIKFYTEEFLNKGAMKSIEKFKTEERGKLPIMEIFETYEGEGSKIGTPRVLVRVGGCPVRCINCDTPESFIVRKKGMSVYTIDEVVQEVLELTNNGDSPYPTVREVSITGGEPMMYEDEIVKLSIKLRELGFKTSLETSGMIINGQTFSKFDFVSLDIKSPSTGVSITDEQIKAIYDVRTQHLGIQVKVVISNEDDLAWVEEKLADFINPYSLGNPLILTPNSPFMKEGRQEPSEYLRIMNMIIQWNKGYAISVIPQVHKLLDFR